MSGESILIDGGIAESSQRRSVEERLTAREIFTILWRGRISLVAIPLVITAAVAAAAFLIPARYEATVLVMPASDTDSADKGGGLGAAVSQLGGLASLAGFSGGGNTLKVEAVATLESEALTARYISQNNLLPILYVSQWDSARGQWKSSDPNRIPTLWKANRYFRSSVRNVVDNARTGLITMTITWRDPVQAATWANDLVAMTNQYLRDKAIHDAEKNIAFLNEQAKSNSVVSVQEAIANLTETQLKRVMYARSREQYALKVLDPATIPEKQSFPRPVLWTASAAIIGMFVAVLFVLLSATSSRERQ
jgi:uncharacterized protein involved in exopolysaccharide biosynthesis